MIKGLYDLYPLAPHFYIVKLAFTVVYIFFLVFALKHRLCVFLLIFHILLTSTEYKQLRLNYSNPFEFTHI